MRLHIYVGNIRGDADETIEGNKWAKTISLILYLELVFIVIKGISKKIISAGIFLKFINSKGNSSKDSKLRCYDINPNDVNPNDVSPNDIENLLPLIQNFTFANAL